MRPCLRAIAIVLAVVAVSPAAATAAAGAPETSAAAIGVDGLNLHVDLPRAGPDDRRRLELDAPSVDVAVDVANTTDRARTARVYAVTAERGDGGGYQLDAPDSAPWLALDADELRLEPGEHHTLTARVHRHRVPDELGHAAVVLETGTGTTVVGRAAAVFELRGQDAGPGLDLLVTVAVLLMGGVILGHLLRVRTRVEAVLTQPGRRH